MRKLKEVLRLHSLGMSQHQIARSCSISQSTVHDYVSAAQATGIKWPLPEDWGDPQIGEALFPRQRRSPEFWRKHPEPDWAGIHKDQQTHKNLTLQLIWQEKRESDPEGYGYSRFCELYGLWLKKLDVVLRQTHRAGEKMFVDYAGATVPDNLKSAVTHPSYYEPDLNPTYRDLGEHYGIYIVDKMIDSRYY